MGITSAIVLFAVFWILTFMVILPFRVETQGDRGDVLPGTHAGAPQVHHLKRKFWITTAIAFVLWAITSGVIISGVIEARDFDFFNRMGPPAEADEISG